MRIDKIEVKPVQNSINPEMVFEIELYIQRKYEIPLLITGCIISDEKKKIANLYELIEPNRNIELSARYQGRISEEEEKLIIKVNAQLNYKVLDYIETLRTKNLKGDVILTLDIFIKTLISKTSISRMFLVESRYLPSPYQLQEPYRNAMPVFYQYQDKSSEVRTDMWILSGDGSPTFIEIQNNNIKKEVTIPSSDWIHDYCPVFQIGKFSVFEYLMPDYTEGSGIIKERLNKSINAIKEMEKNLIEGEWNQVIEDSRAVWELLRNQDEIKDLLTRDGHTEQAFTDLNDSLKKLFDYASKFHHKEDKGKKIMGDIKASKEDAYLIYTISMNIINLISKKMQRLSTKNK